MKSVCRLRFPVSILVLMSSLFAISSPAQELWPGMDGYLSTQLVSAPNGTPEFAVVNLYTAGLVAFSWNYDECGRSARHSGNADLAWTLGKPWERGQSTPVGTAASGCTGVITAAVFADGKELGNPDVLRGIHNCRKARWEEVHRTLKEDILAVPLSAWDPDLSVSKLRERRAQFSMYLYTDDSNAAAMQACRTGTIEFLTSQIEDYQSSVKSNPEKYEPRRFIFLEYLKEIETALTSSTYPTNRTWWKAP